MLLTLWYVALTYYLDKYPDKRMRMRLMNLIANHARKQSSIVIRRAGTPRAGQDWSANMLASNSEFTVEEVMDSPEYDVQEIRPRMTLNLKDWTCFLASQSYPKQPCEMTADSHFILLQAQTSRQGLAEKYLQLDAFASPLAWKAGDPFGLVAVCQSLDRLSDLGKAFLDGNLQMDDMLELCSITTVNVEGHAQNLLRSESNPEFNISASPCKSFWPAVPENSDEEDQDDEAGGQKPEDVIIFGQKMSYPSNEGATCNEFFSGCGEGQADWSPAHLLTGVPGDGDSDVDSSTGLMEGAAGEAPSEPLEILAPEVLTPVRRHDALRSKPPNILVYCGKKDATRQYNQFHSACQHCMNMDKYAIYHLKHADVLSTPWADNTVVLVIASEKVYDGVDEAFLQFFQRGGTLISFSSAFDSLLMNRTKVSSTTGVISLAYNNWQDVTLICGRYVYASGTDSLMSDVSATSLAHDQKTQAPVIMELCHENSGGVAIVSQVNLDKDPMEMAISPQIFATLKKHNKDRLDILRDLFNRLGCDTNQTTLLPLTPTVLYATNKDLHHKFTTSIKSRMRDGVLKSKSLSLKFIKNAKEVKEPVTSDLLPVITDCNSVTSRDVGFSFDKYAKNLDSKVLGTMVLYTEVVTSTMDLFDGLMYSMPEDVGIIAIAARQTQGKGRGGNQWLSPLGCAMFSLHVRVRLSSPVGQRVACLQHLVALAAVQAVRTLPGYEEIDLRVKWPNDIYFGNLMKIGGVLVNSSVMQDLLHANIGCGMNVNNSNPTVCINDLITQYNEQHGTQLERLSTECIIARTVTQLESLIDMCQSKGLEAVLPLYYKRWLHSGSHVRLERDDGPEAIILGLDDHGYLKVQTTDGSTISVQPDGNSFDMMRNLIHFKTR